MLSEESKRYFGLKQKFKMILEGKTKLDILELREEVDHAVGKYSNSERLKSLRGLVIQKLKDK